MTIPPRIPRCHRAPDVGECLRSGCTRSKPIGKDDPVHHGARVRRLEARVPPVVDRCPDCGGPYDPHGVKIYLPENGRDRGVGGSKPCARCAKLVIYTPEEAC